ncbi:hypothetical protein RND71_026351 [Anisodus tanguticus]|uniref:Uncharacterized protein n=1 Tax=Anisodus tanguticus TaxID=243964 RepID=A0AAE1V3Q5_9SOLA|nr:hypothetical protein RND71_026351 [Anisodus tanguticus]
MIFQKEAQDVTLTVYKKSLRPEKRSRHHDKETEEGGVDERERKALNYEFISARDCCAPEAVPWQTVILVLGHDLKKMRSNSDVSTVVYRVGECMQELVKLWKEYETTQADRACESAQIGPTLEIRIPAEHVSATNRQVRGGQLWGTDVYTVDSLIADLYNFLNFYFLPLCVFCWCVEVEVAGSCFDQKKEHIFGLIFKRWKELALVLIRRKNILLGSFSEGNLRKPFGFASLDLIILRYCRTTASPLLPTIQELSATIRVLPPQDCYISTLRNNVRSRAWGAVIGCSYQVERCHVVKKGGGTIDLETCLTHSLTLEPTLAPVSVERTMTTRAAASNALRQQKFVREVTIQFNLCNEPWMKYSISVVADKGLKKPLFTSLSGDPFAEATSALPETDGEKNVVDGENIMVDVFKWSCCKKPLPQKLMRSVGIPLLVEHAEVLEENLEWEDIQWSQTGV